PPPTYSIDAGRCETESNDFFSGRSDPKISQSSNGKGHGSKESNQKIIKNVNDDGSQQNDNDKGNTDDDGSKSKRCNSGSISERKNETEGTEEMSDENMQRDGKGNGNRTRYLVSRVKD